MQINQHNKVFQLKVEIVGPVENVGPELNAIKLIQSVWNEN